MPYSTKIEWADATLNILTGCRRASPGCLNCYAERQAKRLKAMGVPAYQDVLDDNGRWNGDQVLGSERAFRRPFEQFTPTRWFVNSMSDLFLNDAELNREAARRLWEIAKETPQHIYMVLTKYPKNMQCIVNDLTDEFGLAKNIWLGVSAENQEWFDKRAPVLIDTPAAIRFVSLGPLLGPIDVSLWLPEYDDDDEYNMQSYEWWKDILFIKNACLENDVYCTETIAHHTWNQYSKLMSANWMSFPEKETEQFVVEKVKNRRFLDLVIVEGESGPGARPMHPNWANSLLEQCTSARIPFHFKQWGEWRDAYSVGSVRKGTKKVRMDDGLLMYRVGKKKAGRILSGMTWDEMPIDEDL